MADLAPFIDQLKARLPIEEVVSQKVKLQSKGNLFWGLCPFHAEKTPSFAVYPSTNTFKCYGCSEGGDIITFIQKVEGLDFIDAVRVLSSQAGMEMPSSFSRQDSQQMVVRGQIREALKIAKSYYSEQLYLREAAPAREYLLNRKVSLDSCKEFGLGWAPRDGKVLLNMLAKSKIETKAIVAAGLAYIKNDSSEVVARFNQRLMFPIADSGGRVLGFSGRFLPGSWLEKNNRGKYVNSPEGPLFQKKRLLMGIEKLQEGLRNQPNAPIIVCEGNLDLVQMHSVGHLTTVANLGTAFTEFHSRTLKRYDRPIVLLFDSDSAGAKAAYAAARILVSDGVDVRIAVLPDGKDPADMIVNGDKSLLNQVISDSWDILDWRLDTWSRKSDLSDATTKGKAAKEMAEWIEKTPNSVIAESWERQTASFLDISQSALRQLYSTHSSSDNLTFNHSTQQTHSTLNHQEVLQENEREILSAILLDPSAYSVCREKLDLIEFDTESNQLVLDWIRREREQGHTHQLLSALAEFSRQSDFKWLDSIRHLEIPDPVASLKRAIDALPGNQELFHMSKSIVDGYSLEDLKKLENKNSHPSNEL